jgi:hypothetical protein
LLTDSDAFAGNVLAGVYSTRMMSSLQTCSLRRAELNVKVIPAVSTAYAVLAGGGLVQVIREPPVPPWTDVPPLLPALPPVTVLPPVAGTPPVPVTPAASEFSVPPATPAVPAVPP